jgi:hypothetical protein
MEIDQMGDIREFWIAVAICVFSATMIFVVSGMLPWMSSWPVLRLVAVLGGGIILSAVIIFAWAGVAKLFERR